MAGIGKKKKKKFDYYDAFEAQAALCVKEAKLLKEIVHDFESAAELEKELPRAHAIEREADGVCHIEDEADALFLNIIRELYVKECDNPLRVSVWTRLFEAMEDCVDQCEAVANEMSMIMVKYA